MNLVHMLNQLEASQLVRLSESSALAGDMEFVFKHALVQEMAYATLLKSTRAELHRRVAETLEAFDSNNQDAAVLAMHYALAGLHKKAFSYAMQAGDAARARYANQEALLHYEAALAAATQLTPADGVPASVIATAYAHRGGVLQLMGNNAGAIDAYRDMIAFAERAGDSAVRAGGLNLLNRVRIVTYGARSVALDDLDAALTLAQESEDTLLTGNALWNFGLYYRFLDPLKAAGYLQQAHDVAQPHAATDEALRFLAANAQLDSMIAMIVAGRFRRALDYGRRAMDEFRVLDNKHMLADAIGGVSLALYYQGQVAESLALGDEGVRISRAIDNPWGVTYNEWRLYEIELDRGNHAQVLAQFERRRAMAQTVGFPVFIGMVLQEAARVYLDSDQPHLALALSDESADAFGSVQLPTWEMWGRAVRALPRLRMGDLAACRPLLQDVWQPGEDHDHEFQGFLVAGPVIAEWLWAEGRHEQGLRFSDWLISRLEAEDARRPAAEMLYWRAQLRLATGDAAGASADVLKSRAWLAACDARVLLHKAEALWARMAPA